MDQSTIISFIWFICVSLLGFVLVRPVMDNYMDSYSVRLKKRTEKEIETLDAPQDSQLMLLFEKVGKFVVASAPFTVDKRTLDLLSYANYRTKSHLHRFTGIRSAFAVAMLLWGLNESRSNALFLLYTPVIVYLGWSIPNFFLAGRAKERQAKIVKELPTIIDLLIVTSQAGLSLLAGVNKLSIEAVDSCPYLAAELQQMINDIKMFAKSVPIALREMGERCGVEEIIAMAAGLIAAESKGADISYPLRQQAEALRDKLKRRQEEIAAKVPVKMVPVIMVFVMPLILLPMLGPAGLTIVGSLGGLGSAAGAGGGETATPGK